MLFGYDCDFGRKHYFLPYFRPPSRRENDRAYFALRVGGCVIEHSAVYARAAPLPNAGVSANANENALKITQAAHNVAINLFLMLSSFSWFLKIFTCLLFKVILKI